MSTKKTSSTKAQRGSATDKAHAAQGNELSDFAHHLSETLRIARRNPVIPASLYNDLAEALLNFENSLPSLSLISETEAHIMLTIEGYLHQTSARMCLRRLRRRLIRRRAWGLTAP